MKRVCICLLAVFLLLSLTACRRRIDPDSDTALKETVFQPNPVPMEGQGQQIPSGPANPDNTKVELDPNGNRVDEQTPAQGGEVTPDAPEAPDKGAELTVTLDAQGGECSQETVKVHVGGTYGILPEPKRMGYRFQGWFLEAEGGDPISEITVVLKETDHTLYAHWTQKTEFILTFDPNGGRVSPYSAEKKAYTGSYYGRFPEPIREGYVFLGWFTEPDGGTQEMETDIVTAIDDFSLYAHWQYDPFAYWAFVLENTTQKVFTCQEVFVYLELAADGATQSYSPLLADIGAGNIAEKEEDGIVTDQWVLAKKPSKIIKIAEDMSNAEVIQTTVERRFPGCRVYVFPKEALDGSEAEQLYYKLRLAALCYPQYYWELDMEKVASELGVTGSIQE